MATLEIIKGLECGRHFEIAGPRTVIGRAGCDIVLKHECVSRRHAQIVRDRRRLYVEDLGGINGTSVNDEKIQNKRRLNDGDEIRIGAFTLRFSSNPGKLDAATIDSLIDLLQSQHVSIRGPRAERLEVQLAKPRSSVSLKLRRAFHKLVLIDALEGCSSDGRFDMNRFLPTAWKRISKAFRLHYDPAVFHPEQIAQALKSEAPALFCLLHVDRLSEDDLHCLRGLGFTQENHHVLYVGANPNLGTIAFPDLNEQSADYEFTLGQALAVTKDSSFVGIDTSSSIDWTEPASAMPQQSIMPLIEVMASAAHSRSFDQALLDVLRRLGAVFAQLGRGVIIIRGEGGELAPITAWFRERPDDSLRFSHSLVERAMTSKEAILSYDSDYDERFGTSHSLADFRFRSCMCAPVLDFNGDAIGALLLDTLDNRHRFGPEDLKVLACVALQIGLAINNARAHEILVRQHLLDRDLQLASSIQRGILPKQQPTLGGYEFSDCYEAADLVGGDFLDYIPLERDRVVLVIGDVAGRGIPAALVMASLCSTIRYHLNSEPSLQHAMSKINRDAVRAGEEQRFATMLLVEVNSKVNTLTILNAGHLAPVIRRENGRIESPGGGASGLPAGITADLGPESWPVTSIAMNPGDRAFLYTDGVAEVLSPDGQVYGIERIGRLVADTTDNLTETVRRLVADAHAFAGGRKLSDDFCLIACQRVR